MDHLVAFVVTTRVNHAHLRLDAEALGMPLVVMNIEDARHKPFVCALNETNQSAFGGANMGMPRWVMLDCGILPSAIVGFALPREVATPDLLKTLKIDPATYDYPLVPVTEYCATPTVEPGCVSGFSLQSQVTGRGLATRTKALALWVYRATSQVGVTQYDNPAIRVHARFGPLALMLHQPSIHTHATKSFVYRVALPPHEELLHMAQGTRQAASSNDGSPLSVDWRFRYDRAADSARLFELIEQGMTPMIVPPGWYQDEDGPYLELHLQR